LSGTHIIGKEGEELAVNFLVKNGMTIIKRNYRCRHGEIDIIAVLGQEIVFIEVKSWSAYGLEDLKYSLDTRKQRKIIKTAKYFLSLHREYNKMIIRFDVVFIKKDTSLSVEDTVTHLASAFIEDV